MTKIRSRILISSAVIIILFSVSAFFTIFFNRRGIAITESVQSEELPLAHRLEEIAISIPVIQRWIMDSALTGDSFGLDRADQVYSNIRQHIQEIEKQSDGTRDPELDKVLELVEEMSETGFDMVEAFDREDEDEGLYLLEDFCDIADDASDIIEDLRSSASDQVSLSAFQINEDLQFINRISIIAIIISIVVSTLYSLFSTSSISRPVEKLCTIALSMAEGNLNQTIPGSKFVEIKNLSTAIKDLIDSLNEVISKIQLVSNEITGNNEKKQEALTSATAETQAALTEIGSNLDSIRTQTVSLESMMRDLSVSAQQISQTADILETQVEQQVGAVTESSASVEEMIRSIENIAKTTQTRSESAKALETVLESGRSKLSASAQTARKLAEYIDQMNSITKLITAISGKSALLSMNASIEAAHAGQQGLGFAVVADEMSKLSEDTNKNASLIRDIINQAVAQIQELTDETLQATDAFNAIGTEVNNVLAALLEISNTMDEMSAGSAEIASAVSNLSEVSTKVSEATENMKSVSQNVEKNVLSTEEISMQVQMAVSEIGVGTRDVQDRILSIFDRVSAVVESIESIHESVDIFTIADAQRQL